MRRRTVLALGGVALSWSVAGCTGGSGESPTPTTRSAPDVSCRDGSRPEPLRQEPDDAIQPSEYPGPPPSPLDDESAVEYVKRFERAYTWNEQIAQSDDVIATLDVTVTEHWTYDAPPDAAVVRLQYVYSGRTEDPSTGSAGAHFDSPELFVSYYVDPTLVVRTGSRPGGGEDLDPDPWEDGKPVACFE